MHGLGPQEAEVIKQWATHEKPVNQAVSLHFITEQQEALEFLSIGIVTWTDGGKIIPSAVLNTNSESADLMV